METKILQPILQEALGRSAPSSDIALLSVQVSDNRNWPQVVPMFLAGGLIA